ncbi:hypothetical protein C9374_012942 [Naegleria lovaniensis]|uniref:Uncharacterized protein n=1 Tax=Naegleria lovaniensis TaxID=51637 RepID=A0AA88GC09_NAELO|nr:uncharacterized protein C9374_012942 [Naegleria lovaniensis]KAG2372999.1 hypothetical protein C9374_012942 [Naegleria lovaniensis]
MNTQEQARIVDDPIEGKQTLEEGLNTMRTDDEPTNANQSMNDLSQQETHLAHEEEYTPPRPHQHHHKKRHSGHSTQNNNSSTTTKVSSKQHSHSKEPSEPSSLPNELAKSSMLNNTSEKLHSEPEQQLSRGTHSNLTTYSSSSSSSATRASHSSSLRESQMASSTSASFHGGATTSSPNSSLCKENTLSLDLSLASSTSNGTNQQNSNGDNNSPSCHHSQGNKILHPNSSGREAEELFVKTLSARSSAAHQKPQLPTTPRGEGIVSSPKQHHDHNIKQSTSSPKKGSSLSASRKTNFSPVIAQEQVELNRFDEVIHCDFNYGRHQEMPYKNMTGFKLCKIEEMYQNYSKPISVVPHVLDEHEIIEKRLKKIKSTSPVRSSKEFVKGDALLNLTHDGDTNNNGITDIDSPPYYGTVINSSVLTDVNASVWTSPPSPIASLNSSLQQEGPILRSNQGEAELSHDVNPNLSHVHKPTTNNNYSTSPVNQRSIKISANIPSCNRASFETCSSMASHNHDSPSNQRCSSPNSTSPKNAWSKFTGGFYNSPRCFNTNYRHCSNPNYIRKNADDESTLGGKKLGVESEKDPPMVRKRKEELHNIHQNHSVVSAAAASKRYKSNGHATTATSLQRSHLQNNSANTTEDVKSLIDSFEKTSSSQKQNPSPKQVPSDSASEDLRIQARRTTLSPSPPPPGEIRKRNKSRKEDIEKKRDEEFGNPNTLHSVHAAFVPQFKPKRGSCTSPTFNENPSVTNLRPPSTFQTSIRNEISISGKDNPKKHSILNYHDFDRNTMFIGDDHEENLKQLLNPKNYPIDLFPQVDALRRRKNMAKSDYKNFNALRSSKLHTAYLCFRRSTINRYLDYKHQLENQLGKDKAPLLPHHLMGELRAINATPQASKKQITKTTEKIILDEDKIQVSTTVSEQVDQHTSLPEIVPPPSNNQVNTNSRNAVSFTL